LEDQKRDGNMNPEQAHFLHHGINAMITKMTCADKLISM